MRTAQGVSAPSAPRDLWGPESGVFFAAGGSAGAALPAMPTNVYNWAPSTQFPNTRAKYAANQPIRVMFFGDSTLSGEMAGTGTGGRTNYINFASPKYAAAKLATYGGTYGATSDTWAGTNSFDYNSDSRVTYGGAASQSGANSIGGPFRQTTGVGGSVNFDLGYMRVFDRVTVYHLAFDGGFDLKVDGGSLTGSPYVTPGGSPGPTAVSTTFNFTRAAHQAIQLLSSSASSNFIAGMVVWDSQAPTIELINAGLGGAQSSYMLQQSTDFGSLPMLAAAGACQAWFGFAINDAIASVSKATYKSNALAFIDACQAASIDPVLFSPNPTDPAASSYDGATGGGPYSTLYTAALQELAVAENVPFVQDHEAYSYATISAAGWMGDQLHPNSLFHADRGNNRWAPIIVNSIRG